MARFLRVMQEVFTALADVVTQVQMSVYAIADHRTHVDAGARLIAR